MSVCLSVCPCVCLSVCLTDSIQFNSITLSDEVLYNLICVAMGFDVKRFQFLLSLCYNNIDNDHNSEDDNDSHNIDNEFLYSINYSHSLTQLSSVLFFFSKSLYFLHNKDFFFP